MHDKTNENLITEDILPERIVFFEGNVCPQSLLKAKSKQIGIGKEDVVVFEGRCAVVLDFGKEIVGGVRILNYFSDAPRKIRLRFGESVSETCAEIGEKNATNDHALRDFTVELPQLSDGVYGNTGFRFLRIDTYQGRLEIKSVYAHDHKKKVTVHGSFFCNDERVNEIYAVAKETLLCNLQNGYVWDGVKRDRLVWIGDLHPELMGISCLLGQDDSIENCLRLAVEQTPLPEWMNTIPAYSLWWIIDLYDWYMQTGEKRLLDEHKEYLGELLKQVDGLITDSGETKFHQYMLDWQTHGKEDEIPGVAALALIAAKCGKRIMLELGGDISVAEGMIKRLQRRKVHAKTSKSAVAMEVLAGLFQPDAAKSILTDRGAMGVSTFTSYYVFHALSKSGAGAEALKMCKKYYGGMLDKGACTFWEDWSPDWAVGSSRIDRLPAEGEKDVHGDFGAHCYKGFRHSLCHGWSCGPVPFFAHDILGVRVKEAGCKTVSVSPTPDLCGLQWAKGVYPTPYGDITIEHEMRPDGRLISDVRLPEGVRRETAAAYTLQK